MPSSMRCSLQRQFCRTPALRHFSCSATLMVSDPASTVSAGMHQTPIVDELWQRQMKAAGSATPEVRVFAADHPKTPQFSRTSITYPFSSSEKLRDSYSNPWGKIRVGRVLEDLDALAGNIAAYHCESDQPPLVIVTASVDRITMRHRANLKDDMTLSGTVAWVGTSSLEIHMAVTSSWTDMPWLTAQFVFVARDPQSGKAARVPPLAPETQNEKDLFERCAAISQARKQARKERDAAKADSVSMLEWPDHQYLVKAQDLLKKSVQLTQFPSLMGHYVFQSDTAASNQLICQPQQRNTRGRVFGGFLMRRAFELGFATSYSFSGAQPRFREVDRVVFHSPVEIGDLLRLRSTVLYTSTSKDGRTLMHIEVEAFVAKPEHKSTVLSNTFNFTFESDGKLVLPEVLPASIEEAHKAVCQMSLNREQEVCDAAPSAQ
eukprot:CAMPEP_0177654780 /NCGR_PEP_ID=MMETSP0447-20121125/14539_1 /TAXON_ID=0 /ORGANISM="Stygamoeba regulata, Strain BSH-02190019" /LENGTH=433 /DNA_ID=CAMNT_0019158501 /DNA_START=503 /DNA_END=1804 /DNA_ORIENTATION=-